MTPAARIAAAIEILDRTLAGAPAEQVLTTWARGHRFAGSGDRAAIRDHVYDVLRCRGSYAVLGGAAEGAPSGRALMLGLCRAQGLPIEDLFAGEGFAPAPLTEAERAALAAPIPEDLEILDWPAWLRPAVTQALGADFGAVSALMRTRAPVFLRVNLAKVSRAAAQAALAGEGIETQAHSLADSALEITAGARKLAASKAYAAGLVELQDAASQAMIGMLDLRPGMRVLDYCAGGGGKALALAAREPQAKVAVHDIDAGRMRDIPARAARAGATLRTCPPGRPGGPYDLVLVDAPCSGSGTWRRTPEAKWRLTPEALAALVETQRAILQQAADLVVPGGVLAYMTCSVLEVENTGQAEWFAQTNGWPVETCRQLTPMQGADGFFGLVMRRPA